MSDAPPDEGALVAALRRGERAALDVVYDRYRPRVFAFLARMTRDRLVAEDLLQDTFVRLAQRAAYLAADTRLRPWLFTVARNLALDHRRRQLLDFDRLDELATWPTPRREERSPFVHLEASETERRLEAALATLPAPEREAVLLVAVEGLAPAEAAEVLDLQGPTLRKRLSRGRKRLAAALDPDRARPALRPVKVHR